MTGPSVADPTSTPAVPPSRAPRLVDEVVPRGRIRRILLATDLESASDAAERLALDLASELGAGLLIVSVIDRHIRPGRSIPLLRVDQVRTARERAAQALASRGRRRGINVEFLIWEGEAGESIVDAAASEQTDLVIVGTHGRGSVGRLVNGSVSEHVVRHAACPVLVVPNPGR